MSATITTDERAILLIAWEFGKIHRYLGLVPEKHLVSFAAQDVAAMVEGGYLQKMKLKAFSQKIKGYKLTEDGYRQLDLDSETAALDAYSPLNSLLLDIYCHSRLSWSGTVASKERIVKHHSREIRLEAYTKGLVGKVKVQTRNFDAEKGYILTSAGYSYLKGNNLL